MLFLVKERVGEITKCYVSLVKYTTSTCDYKHNCLPCFYTSELLDFFITIVLTRKYDISYIFTGLPGQNENH